MDPLSIAASVAGLLALGPKLVALLSYISRLSNAPPLCKAVLAEVSGTTSALAQIETFLNSQLENVPRERQEVVLLEHLATALTGCVMANADLDAVLDGLGLAYHAGGSRGASVSGVFDKMRWIRREEEIKQVSERLQNHKATLNLILTVFQCTSTAQVRESLDSLSELVRTALANNATLLQRIGRLEGNSTIGHPDTDSDDGTLDAVRSPQSSDEPGSSQDLPSLSFAFDAELENSRVYRKLHLIGSDGHSATSMTSSSRRKIVASIFSTISLADISNISLYSLPIFLHEVGNSGWYIQVARASASKRGIRVSNSAIVFSVKDLHGVRYEFTVDPQETVFEARVRLESKSRYPPNQIVLVYSGQGGKFVRFEDSRTFASYNLESDPDATVDILLRYKAGGRGPRRRKAPSGGQVDVNYMRRFDGG